MTKQEYLQQYQLTKQELQRLLAEKSRWEELACRISPALPPQMGSAMPVPAPVTGYSDRVLQNILLWEAQISQQVDGLLSLRRAIDDAIGALPDRESRLVLKYRYIDGLTTEEIAARMHYCQRHISRLHESALQAIRLPGTTPASYRTETVNG